MARLKIYSLCFLLLTLTLSEIHGLTKTAYALNEGDISTDVAEDVAIVHSLGGDYNYTIGVAELVAKTPNLTIIKKVEDVEIKLVAPIYLNMSTEERIPNKIAIFARRTGSGSLLRVDTEVGVKFRYEFPSFFSVYIFLDVDVEISFLGYHRWYPDLFELEWPVAGVPEVYAQLYQEHVEEGYVGINAHRVQSRSLLEGVEIETLPKYEWTLIGSEDIFVVRDPQTPDVELLYPAETVIGPMEIVSEDVEIRIPGQNVSIAPSQNYTTIKMYNLTSTLRMGPVHLAPENLVIIRNITLQPAWGQEGLTVKVVPHVKENVSIPIMFKEGALVEVMITTRENITDFVLAFQQKTEKPTKIAEGAPDHVYRYFHLNANIKPDIASIVFKFRVEKSWMLTNNIDEQTITLTKFRAGTWETLPTEKIDEDEIYIYYMAESPGLSFFAITAEERMLAFPFFWLILTVGSVTAIAIISTLLYKRRRKPFNPSKQ